MTWGFSESVGEPLGAAALARPRVLRGRLVAGAAARHARLRRAVLAVLQPVRDRRQDHELRARRSSTRRSAPTRATACSSRPDTNWCQQARRAVGGTEGPNRSLMDAGQQQHRAAPRHRLGRLRQRQDGAARRPRAVLPARAAEPRAEHRHQPAVRDDAQRHPHARHARRSPATAASGRRSARPTRGREVDMKTPNNWQWNVIVPARGLAQHHDRSRLRRQLRLRPAADSNVPTRCSAATSTATASTTAWSSCHDHAGERRRCASSASSATATSASGRTTASRRTTRCRRSSSAASAGGDRSSSRPTRCPARGRTWRSPTAAALAANTAALDHRESGSRLGPPGDRPHAHLQRVARSGCSRRWRTSRALMRRIFGDWEITPSSAPAPGQPFTAYAGSLPGPERRAVGHRLQRQPAAEPHQ